MKLLLLICVLFLFAACGTNDDYLDPGNPVTITVWTHYTGIVLNAFNSMVYEFNNGVGRERGIIVESESFGNISELENAVRASDLPNIFTSFPDTAYATMSMGLLSNLNDFLPDDVKQEYFAPFIERGRIGFDGELHIFPVAMSTEVLMINETGWLPFAQEFSLSSDDLRTMEGIAYVAGKYYGWSGGRSFFGRDAVANLFIIASKQFGVEIFEVNDGEVTVNVNEYVMRRIWDFYYVPFINGYFASYGRFRSDDLRVGDILAYIGSTVSAAFFPEEVRLDGESHPITAKVLPVPLFEGGRQVIVEQGAGMVVTKATPAEQYASLVFLQWFTAPQQNVAFAAMSGHVPVKTEAMSYELIRQTAAEENIELTSVTNDALRVALDAIYASDLVSVGAFSGGSAARAVLENHLQQRAVDDREAIRDLIDRGVDKDIAIAQFNNEQNFQNWLADFRAELYYAAN